MKNFIHTSKRVKVRSTTTRRQFDFIFASSKRKKKRRTHDGLVWIVRRNKRRKIGRQQRPCEQQHHHSGGKRHSYSNSLDRTTPRRHVHSDHSRSSKTGNLRFQHVEAPNQKKVQQQQRPQSTRS